MSNEKLHLNQLVYKGSSADLALGETARAYHKGCSNDRETATITRTPPGWVMHCFKCGSRGFDYARVAPLPGKTRTPTPTGIRLSPHQLFPMNPADARILASYGMVWATSKDPRFVPLYDEREERLCFPLACVDKGRTDPASSALVVGWVGKGIDRKPKWLLSDNSTHKPEDRAYFYHSGNVAGPCKTIVLTEDPISALKIAYASRHTAGVAMLGLSMPPGMLEFICNGRPDVQYIVWPDGDMPGIDRGTKIYQQIKFIRPSTKLTYVMGKDPKDLSLIEIGEELARVCA